MIPHGMTLQDAAQEYEQQKKVITGNDGKLTPQGIECQICYEIYPIKEMIMCPCDGQICPNCCNEDECVHYKNDECSYFE